MWVAILKKKERNEHAADPTRYILRNISRRCCSIRFEICLVLDSPGNASIIIVPGSKKNNNTQNKNRSEY